MRGLAACLLVGALIATGCGSSNSNSGGNAPSAQNGTASSGAPQSVAVSGSARPTPASLCQPEGVAKLKKKCATGLGKLNKGKAKNPAAACKGMSKKKTKGVSGKSPFAVCVNAAAKLMASKKPAASKGKSKGQNGAADNSSDTSTDDTSTDTTDSTDQLICTDAEGNDVSPDDPNVEDCEPAASASDQTSTDATSTDDTSTDDTSTDTSTDGSGG